MTAQEIRDQFERWEKPFMEALGSSDLEKAKGALVSVDVIQAYALTEIAAQLAELNEKWDQTTSTRTTSATRHISVLE